MVNKLQLEEGMNAIDVDGWGMMHVWVRDGNVTELTLFNVERESIKTHRIHGGASGQYIKLLLKTQGDENK
tara:strand:+ start:84 stop:296 length:213 start_codon:yes stop_codon:yes gene_type:complete